LDEILSCHLSAKQKEKLSSIFPVSRLGAHSKSPLANQSRKPDDFPPLPSNASSAINRSSIPQVASASTHLNASQSFPIPHSTHKLMTTPQLQLPTTYFAQGQDHNYSNSKSQNNNYGRQCSNGLQYSI